MVGTQNSMLLFHNMLGLLVVVALFFGADGALDARSIVAEGYPAETHHVTTTDGYILQLHRIPHGNASATKSTGKVVFIMHSILAASNSFTYAGPEYGIAYNLADAGYDVWLGNARGNRYSRHHISLDPDEDERKFFDFSYEEIGLYDLPAMIDYILSTTKQPKLHYIGHTQGGSVFYVLNSMKTAYQSKFASAHLLAGIGYEKHFPHAAIKFLSAGIDVVYTGALVTGQMELNPSNITTAFLEGLVNIKVPRELIAGGSLKQAVHFAQNFRDESFWRFNFGPVENLLKYGNIFPPSYDLSKIRVNVTLHYSRKDNLQGELDVLAMAAAMPNAKARRLARDDFNHLDYLASKDVKILVTDYIIESYKN